MNSKFFTKQLIYVVDPMCSWCWGFSPVFDDILEHYQGQVRIRIMMGGLRPGNTERFDEHRRSYILSHWRAVHERTGQPFSFDFQMGSGFIYDTEPASRAMVVVRELSPTLERAFLRNLQEAFYVNNIDITLEAVLEDLAGKLEIDNTSFVDRFRDPRIKQAVWEEFDQARQLGVDGFPTLLGQERESIVTFSRGYAPFQDLQPQIEQWLQVSVPIP